jgi:hypothetical protein
LTSQTPAPAKATNQATATVIGHHNNAKAQAKAVTHIVTNDNDEVSFGFSDVNFFIESTTGAIAPIILERTGMIAFPKDSLKSLKETVRACTLPPYVSS